MLLFHKFHCFTENVAEGVHNLGADTIKIMLTNVAPLSTDTGFGSLTEIAAGFGYVAGGGVATLISSTQSAGQYILVLNPVTFLATGNIGPFRYAVGYNDTPVTKPVIGWWDNGSSVSLVAGQSLVVNFNLTTGIIRII